MRGSRRRVGPLPLPADVGLRRLPRRVRQRGHRHHRLRRAAGRLDAADYASCTSPKSYTGLAASSHTFDVRATDAASNTDATPATATWTIGTFTTAPTYVGEHEVSSWTTTAGASKSTSSFSVQAGDILVAYGLTADANVTEAIAGGSLTWTARQANVTSGHAAGYLWTATVPSNATITVTFTRTSGSVEWGGDVLQFRNSSGVGASTMGLSSGGPSLGLTTTEAHSAVVVGSAGAKTVGLSAPTGQLATIGALEVKGS